MAFARISVIGLGYVGLPTAATLASRDVEVIGVDIRPEAVDRVNQGRAHFSEPDLDIVLRSVITAGRLRATTTPEPADAFLIAVPTPIDAQYRPDMSAVNSALSNIAPVLKAGDIVIVESTSPVGTTRKAVELIRALRPDLSTPLEAPETADLMFAYCPERILPGQTLRELIDNARIVGGIDKRSGARARDLYRLFAKGDVLMASAEEAELSKLTENAYRDVNIAFANELSRVCELLGINVWNVIRMANHHPRVNILSPGPGVGGHCIPVDPWFIHHALPDHTPLIRTAREVNMAKARHVTERIVQRASRFRAPKVALLGLAYKADVDDLRESPSLEIAHELARRPDIRLLVVEPHIKSLPSSLAQHETVSLAALPCALTEADVVAILVAHRVFEDMDLAQLAERAVIDTVGLLPRLQSSMKM